MGKGSNRRKENIKLINENWALIDWECNDIFNSDGSIKHVNKEGSRKHVVHYDSSGAHCSEPNCELNNTKEKKCCGNNCGCH